MVMSDDDQSPQKCKPQYKGPQGPNKMCGSTTEPWFQFGGISYSREGLLIYIYNMYVID
jgi:hypothetical protein